MSEHELSAQFQRILDLPHHRVEWLEEIIGPDGQPIHCRHDAGTPAQSVDRWRALLARCRTDRHAYAARLTLLRPHPD